MDDFLDNLMLVLPALGFDFYNEDVTAPAGSAASMEEGAPLWFTFSVKREGIQATARLENGKFIVESGSLARLSWIGKGTEDSTYARLHAQLIDQGVLLDSGGHRTFAKDYAFKSTSAAAAVVSGRPATGPQSWVLRGTSKSYAEWEAEQL